MTGFQSPQVAWRNKRIVGYHGESVRCTNQRKSELAGTISHTDTPSAPARCAIDVSHRDNEIEVFHESGSIHEAAMCGVQIREGDF
jgi:hypothetical protein